MYFYILFTVGINLTYYILFPIKKKNLFIIDNAFIYTNYNIHLINHYTKIKNIITISRYLLFIYIIIFYNYYLITFNNENFSRLIWIFINLCVSFLINKSDKNDSKKNYKIICYLLKLTRPDKSKIYLGILFGGIASFSNSYSPHLIGNIIDDNNNISKIKYNLIFLGIIYFVAGIGAGFRGYIFTKCCSNLLIRTKKKLFNKLLIKNSRFFLENTSGEIVSRMTRDITQMSDQLLVNINVIIRTFFQMVFVLLFMFSFNSKLTLSVLFVIPFTWKITNMYSDELNKIVKKGNEIMAKANDQSQEIIKNILTIRSLNSEYEFKFKYLSYLNNYSDLINKQSYYYGFYVLIMNILPNISLILVLLIGTLYVRHNTLSYGELVSFMLYQEILSNNFDTIANVINSVYTAIASADKVFEWIENKEDIDDLYKNNMLSFDNCTFLYKDIIFSNVTFSYNTKIILDTINLTFNHSKINAIVGVSGCGKSSIIKLIMRLYNMDDGEIFLQSNSIHIYNKECYLKKIGLISQEPILFNKSIIANILVGIRKDLHLSIIDKDNEEYNENILEYVKKRCIDANADEFICNELNKGYDTIVGEEGSQLSSGQKQKIVIARALIRNPELLILDEATSALDSKSEFEVQQSLNNLKFSNNCTMIIIAHRLSSIKNADKIMIIDNGKLEKEGTHDYLMKNSDIYEELVSKQI